MANNMITNINFLNQEGELTVFQVDTDQEIQFQIIETASNDSLNIFLTKEACNELIVFLNKQLESIT
jgi:hypothetical protein